jgi:hypothetical protein
MSKRHTIRGSFSGTFVAPSCPSSSPGKPRSRRDRATRANQTRPQIRGDDGLSFHDATFRLSEHFNGTDIFRFSIDPNSARSTNRYREMSVMEVTFSFK